MSRSLSVVHLCTVANVKIVVVTPWWLSHPDDCTGLRTCSILHGFSNGTDHVTGTPNVNTASTDQCSGFDVDQDTSYFQASIFDAKAAHDSCKLHEDAVYQLQMPLNLPAGAACHLQAVAQNCGKPAATLSCFLRVSCVKCVIGHAARR
jgi:hypothetical protein